MLVDQLQVAEVVLLARAHTRLIFGVGYMVVAAEVENPVSQQVRQLGRERMAGGFRLARGRRKRNGNIAE